MRARRQGVLAVGVGAHLDALEHERTVAREIDEPLRRIRGVEDCLEVRPHPLVRYLLRVRRRALHRRLGVLGPLEVASVERRVARLALGVHVEPADGARLGRGVGDERQHRTCIEGQTQRNG